MFVRSVRCRCLLLFEIAGKEHILYELAQIFLRHFRAAFFNGKLALKITFTMLFRKSYSFSFSLLYFL